MERYEKDVRNGKEKGNESERARKEQEREKNRKKGSELKEGEISKTLALNYAAKPLTPINR